MKIKVIQYYVGEDPTYMQLCNVIREINSKYCQMHNYEYKFEKVDIEEVHKFINCHHGDKEDIVAYRQKFAYDQLMKNDCDYLVVLDADAAVSNPFIKIEDVVDNEHDLFLSRFDGRRELFRMISTFHQILTYLLQHQNIFMEKYPEEIVDQFGIYTKCEEIGLGHLMWNEGLIIFKNSDLMKQFLKDLMDLIPIFSDFKSRALAVESKVFGVLTLQNKYKDFYTYLFDYAQGSHYGALEAKYDEDKTFVLHEYQQPSLRIRIQDIKKLKENKWWKGRI